MEPNPPTISSSPEVAAAPAAPDMAVAQQQAAIAAAANPGKCRKTPYESRGPAYQKPVRVLQILADMAAGGSYI
jgi:hypothetical protein